jgi:hypothetical protein
MRRVWPWILVAVGAALVVGGFGHDLIFAYPLPRSAP